MYTINWVRQTKSVGRLRSMVIYVCMYIRIYIITWVRETNSVGRLRSINDAPEMSHLLMGAQKCTVKGPAAAAANVLSTCVRAYVCV